MATEQWLFERSIEIKEVIRIGLEYFDYKSLSNNQNNNTRDPAIIFAEQIDDVCKMFNVQVIE